MNQELYKLENTVRKAESAWDRQMKRDGHLKKESRDISTCTPATMSPTARAFYHEYTAAKTKLDDEANRTNLFGGSPAAPNDGLDDDDADDDEQQPRGRRGKGKASHLQVVTPAATPENVQTPDGMPVKVVAPQLLDDWRALCAAESLGKKNPTAKVIVLEGGTWVCTQVGEGFAVLTRCVTEHEYEGERHDSMEGRDPDDTAGLVFRSGPGRSPQYVLMNSGQSVAAVAGDPLQNVQLQTGTDE